MLDWSLTGSKLAGLPPRGDLTVGTSVELVEGLDVHSFEELAPFLSQPDPAMLDATVHQLRRRLGLRGSTGKIVRVDPKLRHFAIQFDEVSDDGRRYPFAHGRNPSLKAGFTYRDGVGVFTVKGILTPGAAIDLAKDVVNDIRQCLVTVDLSAVRGVNRIAVEKFRTRLLSELNRQDLAYALAVVSPDEWIRELLEGIQTYPTLKQAEEAIRAGLGGQSDWAAAEPSGQDSRSDLLDALDQSSDTLSDEPLE
jgi:hypothetical protein